VLLILVCGATATYSSEHIALRPVKSVRDNQVSSGSQLLINLALAACCAYHYSAQLDSGMHVEHPELPMLWAVGFVVMAGLNLRNLTRSTDDLTPDGSIGHALLTPPLYATMGFISLVWFLGYEQHPAGTAIQLDRLTAQAGLYIQVGLYVWAGMLLKRTRLASLSFDILRPWRFTPELMAIIVVTASAIPTAYSGASGIFVIAAGAVIYDEMRRIGTRNQLALATTALSGSLGVVLSPCLLVVIVAALNKQVTTGELFGAGRWVFLLTAVLFAIIVLLTRRNEISFAPASEAWPATRAAMGRVVPYLAASAVVILAYGLVLDAWINEHTAPKILLVLLIALVVLERFIVPEDQRMGTAKTLEDATAETTGHIGALLMLMALSVAFGGVVERAEVMSLVPEQIDNIWVAMSMLTVMLVCIGMVMDPYGAVILVSATIAQVAYNNGIDPLHFWMVVLVAFELGYLTPPVALNHLLTRTVVGDQADEIDVPADASFWRRHERYMLPMSVMGIALVLVAFGPLMLG
jgi:TRAP-type C4-dicarboxylate transport system permease large subunit